MWKSKSHDYNIKGSKVTNEKSKLGGLGTCRYGTQ